MCVYPEGASEDHRRHPHHVRPHHYVLSSLPISVPAPTSRHRAQPPTLHNSQTGLGGAVLVPNLLRKQREPFRSDRSDETVWVTKFDLRSWLKLLQFKILTRGITGALA